MRRRLAAVLACSVLLPFAACSGDDVPVKVSGAYGKRPDVTIPTGEPGKEFVSRTLVEGDGPKVVKGDLVVADYSGYRWGAGGGKLIGTSYPSGHPGAFPSGKLVKGLEKALVGAKVGSRVVAVLPPKDGYGDKGAPELEVAATDSLVYVLDIRGTFPKSAAVRGTHAQPGPGLPQVSAAAAGQAPTITVPRARPPVGLQVKTLVQGKGPEVGGGNLLIAQYALANWRDGKVFNSSWADGQVYSTVIGTGQVIKGFDQGLVGQRVGSRVLLVVPPALAKAPWRATYGVRPTDGLVYVVDILGAY